MTQEIQTPAANDSIRVIALHGFLGSPADFNAVEQWTRNQLTQFGVAIEWLSVDLVKLWTELDREKRTLEATADRIISQLLKIQQKSPMRTICVGYSMGGRAALALMDLQRKQRGRIQLAEISHWIFISAHPGLTDEESRAKRRLYDQSWSERLGNLNREWAEIWQDWNRQAVLQPGSRLRSAQKEGAPWIPSEEEDHVRSRKAEQLRALWAQILIDWGLGQQLDYRPTLQTMIKDHNVSVDLIAGEEDEKFSTIAKSLGIELKKESAGIFVRCIPQVGHRVILEAPEAVAARIVAHAAEKHKIQKSQTNKRRSKT